MLNWVKENLKQQGYEISFKKCYYQVYVYYKGEQIFNFDTEVFFAFYSNRDLVEILKEIIDEKSNI